MMTMSVVGKPYQSPPVYSRQSRTVGREVDSCTTSHARESSGEAPPGPESTPIYYCLHARLLVTP